MASKVSFKELKERWWDKKEDIEFFSINRDPSNFLPTQEKFFNDRESQAILISGGYRSGKTDILLRKCVLLSLIFDENEGLIGRKTSTEVEVVTLSQLEEICDPSLYKYHPKQGIIQFANGSKIYLRGLDVLQGPGEQDTKKAIAFIRGLNLGWYAIDQAEEVEHSIVEHLNSRLSRNNVPFRQGMMTSNPTNFWAYDDFKKYPKPGYRLLEVSMMENKDNLPQDYIDKQMALKESMPRYYVQYVEGKWDEFMSSENTVMEMPTLDKLRLQVKEPIREWEGFKIYKEPNHRHIYQIGADPTEGKKDRGSISVVDLSTGEEVAKYAKTVLYDILAEKVNAVALLYKNIKRVIPEANNYAFIMELQNYKLRLYQEKTLGTKEKKERTNLGFRTTRDNKIFLAHSFENLVANGKATVYDKDTVDEFHSFVHNGARMEARSGSHDDRVMATFLAYMDADPENPRNNPEAVGVIQRELAKEYQKSRRLTRTML